MMSFQLLFSNNSVRNTAIYCQDLGIRYEISKHDGVVSVYRWDASISRNLRVGEFKLPFFSKDMVKLGGETEWRRLDTFLYRSSWLSSSRSFVGNNGKEYRWKVKNGGVVVSLPSVDLEYPPLTAKVQLHSVSHKTRTPLVTFHRHYRKKHPSYLEVHDPSILHTLDSIIVSFLIMERKRRDEEAENAAVDGATGA
ncbi:hypothetical protein FRC19_003091, partial [Serendipita sp. 401]